MKNVHFGEESSVRKFIKLTTESKKAAVIVKELGQLREDLTLCTGSIA